MFAASKPEADVLEIGFERGGLASRDDGADIAVRPDQRPIPRRHAARVMKLTAIVDEAAFLPDAMDMRILTRRDDLPFGLVADQRPLRSP